EVAYAIISHQCWTNNRELLEDYPDSVGDAASAVIIDGESITTAQYADAFAFGNEWALRIQQLFATYDLLVCPTVSTVAPEFDALRELSWDTFSRTMQFSLSGHPALSAPLDIPGSHLKTGMQFVGAYGSDSSLIATVAEMMT